MKYRLLKIIAIVLAAAIVALAIFYFTQQYQNREDNYSDYKTGVTYPTSPVNLSMWMPADEKGSIESVIEEFKKIHPSVTINVEYFDTSAYQGKLLESAQNQTLPDIFVFRNDGLPLYKKNLTPAPNTVFTKDQYTKTFAKFASQQLVSGDSILAAPLGIATLGLVYNQQRFNQANISNPPRSWTEFESTNNSLRKKEGENLFDSGVALGTAGVRNYPDIISVLMMQNGAVMTNQPPTMATFQLPQADGYQSAAKALAYYASFSQPNKQNYSWSDSLGSSLSALAQNKTALVIDYPMAAKQIASLNSNMQISFASLPQTNPSSPINYGVVLAGGVSNVSKNSEIAWDFLGFATSKTAQRQFSLQSLWPASRLDLIKEQQNDKDLSVFANQINSAQSWYKGINYAVNADFASMLNSYLLGLDAQTAVNNTATQTSAEIQKSNQ